MHYLVKTVVGLNVAGKKTPEGVNRYQSGALSGGFRGVVKETPLPSYHTPFYQKLFSY